jgi:hypothetical protein
METQEIPKGYTISTPHVKHLTFFMALPPDAKILSVMVVSDWGFAGRHIAGQLDLWVPVGYRRCEISHCVLPDASQRKLGAFFGADGRLQQGRRRWTRILIAALAVTQEGLLSDDAMTWLGNNPQALVYSYLPSSHVPGLAPNLPSVVSNMAGYEMMFCSRASIIDPILRLAAGTRPDADPCGMRYLVGQT